MRREFTKSNRLARFGSMCVLIVGLASSTWAAEQTPRQQVRGAEKAFAEGDFPTALEKFTAAQEEIKDSAELAYNRGLAQYKLGQFAEARDRFQEALATRHRELEAKAKFNLGNCAYSEALSQSQKPDEATKLLNQAITHYRDSLEVAPDDNDARANIELAQQMIRKLQEQQQQQQQSQNQDQNQDQNQQNQEKQQQQENQSGNQNDNKPESEKQQQQSSSEGNDNQQQPQPEQQKQEDSKEQPQEPQDDNPQQAEPQEKPSEQDQQVEMTPQETERLLQAVRDKERKRSEEKAKRMKAQRARVARDW